MWDTLALSHQASKGVTRNKLTIFRDRYEFFSIEENKSIQSMIARLQTLLNSLKSLR